MSSNETVQCRLCEPPAEIQDPAGHIRDQHDWSDLES